MYTTPTNGHKIAKFRVYMRQLMRILDLDVEFNSITINLSRQLHFSRVTIGIYPLERVSKKKKKKKKNLI